MNLISDQELRDAATCIAAREAAKESPGTGFKYTPRTAAQIEARRNQTRDGVPAVAKPVTVAPKAQPVTAQKISGRTVCLCGHRRANHCLGRSRLHTPVTGSYWCQFEHCEGQRMIAGVMVACDCPAFRVSENATPKPKQPKADDYTPCANPACGHWRLHHCKIRRPSKAKVPKRRATAYTDNGMAVGPKWEGFEVNGEPLRCKHVPAPDPTLPYRCTSTSCAEGDETTGIFCSCEKFQNPFARPRATPAKPERHGQRKLRLLRPAGDRRNPQPQFNLEEKK
jgi:hypothetical protein